MGKTPASILFPGDDDDDLDVVNCGAGGKKEKQGPTFSFFVYKKRHHYLSCGS